MLLWFQASEPTITAIGEILHLGVSGVLAVGCIVLWRSNQAYAKTIQELMREMFGHAAELEKIPEALERLEAAMRERSK